MHEVLVNRLGGLSLPKKSVVRLTDRPDMTIDVYRGRKATTQRQQLNMKAHLYRHHLKAMRFLGIDFHWMYSPLPLSQNLSQTTDISK